jgi:hypothetical protein
VLTESSTSKQISNKLWKWKTKSCWGVMEGAYNIGNKMLAPILMWNCLSKWKKQLL